MGPQTSRPPPIACRLSSAKLFGRKVYRGRGRSGRRRTQPVGEDGRELPAILRGGIDGPAQGGRILSGRSERVGPRGSPVEGDLPLRRGGGVSTCRCCEAGILARIEGLIARLGDDRRRRRRGDGESGRVGRRRSAILVNPAPTSPPDLKTGIDDPAHRGRGRIGCGI